MDRTSQEFDNVFLDVVEEELRPSVLKVSFLREDVTDTILFDELGSKMCISLYHLFFLLSQRKDVLAVENGGNIAYIAHRSLWPIIVNHFHNRSYWVLDISAIRNGNGCSKWKAGHQAISLE